MRRVSGEPFGKTKKMQSPTLMTRLKSVRQMPQVGGQVQDFSVSNVTLRALANGRLASRRSRFA